MNILNKGLKLESFIKIFILFTMGVLVSALLYGCGLSQVSKTNKLKSGLYYRLGSGYFNNGNYVKALQEFIRAKTVNPYSAKNYNAIGVLYMLTHRSNKAIYNFKKAISINNKFSDAYYNLALIYTKRKEYKSAVVNFLKALSNPFYNQPYESYTQLAKIYIIENKLVKAKKYLLISQALNNKYFLTYYCFGNYYFKNNRFNHAIINYKKAFKLNIYYIPAEFKEALSYYKLKKYNIAKPIFEKVYRQNSLKKFGIKALSYLKKIKKIMY